jgi:hypothetical protein
MGNSTKSENPAILSVRPHRLNMLWSRTCNSQKGKKKNTVTGQHSDASVGHCAIIINFHSFLHRRSPISPRIYSPSTCNHWTRGLRLCWGSYCFDVSKEANHIERILSRFSQSLQGSVKIISQLRPWLFSVSPLQWGIHSSSYWSIVYSLSYCKRL